jgi:hypothetical protein
MEYRNHQVQSQGVVTPIKSIGVTTVSTSKNDEDTRCQNTKLLRYAYVIGLVEEGAKASEMTISLGFKSADKTSPLVAIHPYSSIHFQAGNTICSLMWNEQFSYKI